MCPAIPYFYVLLATFGAVSAVALIVWPLIGLAWRFVDDDERSAG